MPFVGNTPSNNYTSFAKQDLTGASGGTLTLSTSVANENEIQLFINHVRQEPATSYTVSGTTVTLQGYTVSASDDIYVMYSGKALQTVVPPDGSVSSAKLATNIQADTLYNKTGDSDSGLDLSTNDVVAVKTANTERVRVKATGEILHTLPSEDTTFAANTDSTWNRFEIFQDRGATNTASGIAFRSNSGTAPSGIASVAGNTTGGIESLVFITSTGNASSERMRINSDGKIGLGTNDPQEQIHSANSGTNALRVSGAGVNNAKVEIGYDNSAGPYIKAGSSGQTDLHIYTDNNSLAAEFRANGDFYSNDGTVHSLSDIRIKKDVADLTDGLDIVKKLKPKTFKYTEDSEFYNEKIKDKIKYGFVANEVEAVAPQYTDTGKGSIGGKEVNDFKSLSTTKMIPMLVKAIQELSAKNDALEARITKLEGK